MILNKLKQYKGLSLYFVTSMITTVIGLAINPFLSVGLSVDDFAIIGYYSAFSTLFLPLIAFNLGNFYSRKYYIESESGRKEIFQTIMTLFLLFGIVTFLLVFVLYYIYHSYFVKSIPFSPFALLSFLPLYFSSFYNLYMLELRYSNQVKKYSFFTVSNSLLTAIISLFTVYFLPFGAVGRLCSILVVSICYALIAMKFIKFKFHINKRIALEAFHFCWPLVLSGILTFFFMGIDRPLLEKINDTKNLGLYNIGMQISGYVAVFSSIVYLVINPYVFKFTAQSEYKKLIKMFLALMLITFIPIGIFMLVSEKIIYILTYGKYVESSSFANILCLKSITYTFAFFISDSMIGLGITKYELATKIVGAAIVFLIYDYFVKTWGFYGAAWGQTLSWFVLGVINLMVLIYFINKKSKSKINLSNKDF